MDDCVIDPSLEKGTLDITTEVKSRGSQGGLGSYSLTQSTISGLVTIRLFPEETEEAKDIAYFRLMTKEGVVLGGASYVPIGGSFSYLGVLSSGLSDLTIDFYDTNKEFLYAAHFNTGNKTIEKNE